jgi:hypothetical protein
MQYSTRLVGHGGLLDVAGRVPQDRVQQRGLSHIRPPDDGDFGDISEVRHLDIHIMHTHHVFGGLVRVALHV